MSLTQFLKQNKKVRENIRIAASKAFVDEDGNVLEFEFKPLTSRENDAIRERCTVSAPIPGKKGQYKEILDRGKYMAAVLANTCVSPNLNSVELQDSYGVKTPEALIVEMIDNPGEYSDLFAKIAEYNGFSEDSEDKVSEVKN